MPDALVSCALLMFLTFTLWLATRRTPTRGDDKHLADLRKLTAELAALRAQLDSSTAKTREQP